jgi:hypothetical protein
VRVHLQVGLGLLAEDVHFVLVQAFVTAELQLVLTVLEVYVVDGVSDVSAPVAGFVPLEVGSPALGKAHFRTERFLSSRCLQ